MESIWADDKFEEPYKTPRRAPRIAATRKENVPPATRMPAFNVDAPPRTAARPEAAPRTESATSSSVSNGPTLHRPDDVAESRAFAQQCGISGGKRGGGGGGGTRTRATFDAPPPRQTAPTARQPAMQTVSPFHGGPPHKQAVAAAAAPAPPRFPASFPKAAPAPQVENAAPPTPMSIPRAANTTTSAIPAANNVGPASGTAKPLHGVNFEYKIAEVSGNAIPTKEQIAAELRKHAEQLRQKAQEDNAKTLLQAAHERLAAEAAENKRLEAERAQGAAAEKERLELEKAAAAAESQRRKLAEAEAAEKKRLETERAEAAAAEKKRLEHERAEAEAAEKKRLENERAEAAIAKKKREWEIEAAKKASEAATAAMKQAPARQRATSPAMLSAAMPLNSPASGVKRASAFENSREAAVASPSGRAMAAPPSGAAAANPDAVTIAALSYTRVRAHKVKIQQKLSALLAEVQDAELELAEAEMEVNKAFAQLEAATSAPELEQRFNQPKLQQE